MTPTKPRRISATKMLMVLMNIGALLFLVMLIVADWNGKTINAQTIQYAQGFFGFGSPLSIATYLAKRLQERHLNSKQPKSDADPLPVIPGLPGGQP